MAVLDLSVTNIFLNGCQAVSVKFFYEEIQLKKYSVD